MKNILEDNLLDIFIGTLKDNIKVEVCLFEPPSLEKAFMMARKVGGKNMVVDTRNTIFNTYKENDIPSSIQPQILKPQQLEEIRVKGL